MNKIKNNRVLITVLSILLAGVVILGIVSIFSAFSDEDDGFTEISVDFERGALSASGEYVETDSSLYTKEAITCSTIRITKEFDVNYSYKLFFYDDTGFCFNSSSLYRKTETIELPAEAKSCRIVIYPDFEDGDNELNIFEAWSYSSAIEVEIKNEVKEAEQILD